MPPRPAPTPRRCPRLRAARLAVLALAAGLASPSARAQTPPADVHPDFLAERYTVAQGLPSNQVMGLAAEPGGYLWAATTAGLARFDGSRFTVYDATSTPALPGDRLTNVWATPGEVWVRTESARLVRLRGGAVRALPTGHAFPWPTLVSRAGGATWAASLDGVWQSDGGRLVRRWAGAVRGPAWVLRRTPDGAVWVGQPGALLRCRPGRRPQRLRLPAGTVVWDVARDADGRLWAGTDRGLFALGGGRLRHVPAAGRSGIHALYVDAQRRVWVGGPADWLRLGAAGVASRSERPPDVPPGRVASNLLQGPDGGRWWVQDGWLVRGGVRVARVAPARDAAYRTFHLAADAEGHVWAGGPDGLLRVRRRWVSVVGEAEGLGGRNVYPVLAARDGSVWAGLWDVPRPLTLFASGRPAAHLPLGGDVLVSALLEDHEGTVWAGASRLYRVRGGRAEPVDGVDAPAFVSALLEDRRGRLWVGGDRGLRLGVRDGRGGVRWTRVPAPAVRALVETSRGEILVGTNGHGLGRVVAPDRVEWLRRADGLASDQVRDVAEDDRGVLWIATEDRGLCRLARGRSARLASGRLGCVSSRDGLPSDALHRILFDDRGRLWLNSNQGIFALDRAQADRAALGRETVAPVAWLTEADGLRSREGNGGRQPAGSRAPDGRLWFPTQDGLAVVDPAAIGPVAPPPTRVEGVRAGRRALPEAAWHAGPVRLAAGERDLRVEYAALAFAQPGGVRYRVRLVGYSDAWRDVGTARAEAFTNLPPGRYRFEVQAGLGGRWGAAATLPVVRAPHVWERGAVRLLALLAALAGALGLVRLRVRRLERRQRELEATVDERTAALRRANDVKARFLQNVSHELRTPLTLLLGPLRDLRAGRLDAATAAPLLERADAHGRRLERLIGDLLDLSRLDAEAVALDLRRLDLAAFARERVAAFGSRAEAAGVALTLRARPAWVAADPQALETVLYNLVGNALKFTPRGGRVTVRVGPAEGGAELVVADTGPGIAEADRARLFERFYQADTPQSRAGEGAGIGLALTAELVALHGGTIEAARPRAAAPGDEAGQPDGPGATFVVWLPAGDVDRAPRPADAARPDSDDADAASDVADELAGAADAGPDATPLVLVVEDNADLRAYLRAVLEPGFRVDEAADGADGLARAVETVPDLILSDVMMPGVDGFALLAALKGDVRTSHVPVVLLTARADAESRLAGLHGGADDYIPKPFAAAELEARVRNLVETRRRLRTLWRGRARVAPSADTPAPAADAPQAEPLPPAEAAFLARVVGTVEAQMAEATFSVDALAEAVGMSPRQLRRKLTALTGESPAELVRRLRLDRAAALLADGAPSVKEVGHAVGFGTGAGFRKAFRDRFGQSPATYGAAPPAAPEASDG